MLGIVGNRERVEEHHLDRMCKTMKGGPEDRGHHRLQYPQRLHPLLESKAEMLNAKLWNTWTSEASPDI